jgi:hypothetical protein
MLSKPKGKTVLAKGDTNDKEVSSTLSLLDASSETDEMSELFLSAGESTVGTTKQGDSNSNPLSLKHMLSKPSGKTVLAKHTQSTIDTTETSPSVSSDEGAPTIKSTNS